MKRILAGVILVLFWATLTFPLTTPVRPPEKNLQPPGTQLTLQQRIEQSISDHCGLWEAERPIYWWGGSDPTVSTYNTKTKTWGKGTDCSGSVKEIFLRAGIKLPRTTSLKMFLTWPGKQITDKAQVWKQAKLPGLIFFTWEPKRKAGHVGIIRNNKGKTMEFSEASSSKGYFKRTKIVKGDYRDTHTEGIKFVPLLPNYIGPTK